jgi:hypothetical protein
VHVLTSLTFVIGSSYGIYFDKSVGIITTNYLKDGNTETSCMLNIM